MSDSPRNTQPRTATWTSIVLLITLDSTAESTWKDWFQSVNASAVFTTASQRTIAQLVREMAGSPWVAIPVPSSIADPMLILTVVTASAERPSPRFVACPVTSSRWRHSRRDDGPGLRLADTGDRRRRSLWYTMRKSFETSLLVLLVLLAGCTAVTDTSGSPNPGVLTVEQVDSAPSDATVTEYGSQPLGESAVLRSAMDDAAATNASVSVELDGTERQALDGELDHVPRHAEPGAAGYYVEYDSDVFRVQVLVEE